MHYTDFLDKLPVILTILMAFFLILLAFLYNAKRRVFNLFERESRELGITMPKLGQAKHFWIEEHRSELSKITIIYLTLRSLKESGVLDGDKETIKTRLSIEQQGDLLGQDGVKQISQYFNPGSEKKQVFDEMFINKDIKQVQDFSVKAINYIAYFLRENRLFEPIKKSINFEFEVLSNLKSNAGIEVKKTHLRAEMAALEELAETE